MHHDLISKVLSGRCRELVWSSLVYHLAHLVCYIIPGTKYLCVFITYPGVHGMNLLLDQIHRSSCVPFCISPYDR